MAEPEETEQQLETPDQEEEVESAYKAPAEKSIEEILKTDEEDESLRKYKEALLGGGTETTFWPNDPRKVILRKMTVVSEGKEGMEINLEDESQLKNMTFVVKAGAKYRLMITFSVQREIVSGLVFHNKISKSSFPGSVKEKYMLGSYGPKNETYDYKTGEEEFPSGMLARGKYKVKSSFTDDDKQDLLRWEWQMDIKKDWEK